MKTCTECKWCELQAFKMLDGYHNTYICVRPKMLVIDPVTGNQLSPTDFPCSEERGSRGVCGYDASFFEECLK